jgi:hypothetical protein
LAALALLGLFELLLQFLDLPAQRLHLAAQLGHLVDQLGGALVAGRALFEHGHAIRQARPLGQRQRRCKHRRQYHRRGCDAHHLAL